MSKYFDKFPLLYYPAGDQYKLATDILRRVKFTEKTKRNGNGYIEYTIRDGDTPQTIAAKFYGNPYLYWTILILNDKINPYYDWPLENTQLEKFVTAKYGAGFENDTHHFELLSSGTQIDLPDGFLLEDGSPLILEGGLLDGQTLLVYEVDEINEPVIEITNRLYEIAKNEGKRKIRLLRPEFINQAVSQLKAKIR